MRTIKIVVEKEKDIDVVKERLRGIPGVTVEEAKTRSSLASHLQDALDDIPTNELPEEELYDLVQAEINEVRRKK